MFPESNQIPVLVATVLALVTLIFIPLTSMTHWGADKASFTAVPESSKSTSCALPPTLDVQGDRGDIPSAGPLLLDRGEEGMLKTATFALG